MLRWAEIPDSNICGMTVKMYREPKRAGSVQKVAHEQLELDHYAYTYLGSELLMYAILDANFIEYIEERGDVSRLKTITVPLGPGV